MRRHALAGLAGLTLLVPAFAEEATPSASDLRRVLTSAHALAEAGWRDRDAHALLEAGRTLKEFPDRILAPGQSGRNGAAYDIDALLEEALRLDPDDAAMTAQVDELHDKTGPASSEEWWEQICDADGNCRWVRWVCTESNLCQQVDDD